MPDAAPKQRCPNCGQIHNVSVYVTGQRLLCRCGLHFVVSRSDVRRSAEPLGMAGERTERATAPAQRPRLESSAISSRDVATRLVSPPRIPGYEILDLIGRGGMGEVFRARQLSLGRTVAVKILSREFAQDPEFVRRFAKEAAALAALSHPGIVQIVDRGAREPGDVVFFAMELCEGRSLREKLAEGPLSPQRAVAVLAQVARAIGYAHERGVVHRDLKPENVLVDGAGGAKVVDFGLAGLGAGRPELKLTRAATAMGTVHYMAPEQQRDARAADARADVYSLGVMLYECLVGEVPAGRFLLPSERKRGLDKRLDGIVARALSQDPAERHPDAGALACALGELEEPKQRSTRPAPVAGRPRQRARARIAMAAAVLAAVGSIGAAALRWGGRPASGALGDTDGRLGVQAEASERSGFKEIELRFEPGQGATLRAYSGTWQLEGGELAASVWGDKRRPYAALEQPLFWADELVLEAEVAIAPGLEGPEQAAAPRGGLQLQGADGMGISLMAIVGRGYEVLARSKSRPKEPPALVTDRAPEPGRRVAMRLKIHGGEIEASAGAPGALEVLFRGRAPAPLAGRVALLCSGARCRFGALSARGHTAPQSAW